MKQILFFLMISVIAAPLYSQVEPDAYKKATKQLGQFYNESKYDSIFAMFNPAMQKSLPLTRTVAFFTELKTHAGNIVKQEYLNQTNDKYLGYKTTFEKSVFQLELSLDENTGINALLVSPFVERSGSKMVRNETKLILPFNGKWTVIWGGDTKQQNYHVDNVSQKNAFDLVITNPSGSSYKRSGNLNEDYYAFGKEIIAPCDAEVVLVVDGIKDNTPGQTNPIYTPGNTVILKTDKNEFLFFAHFKQRSIKVSEGQKIKQGQLLGLCGNSGNSSEAHLHFHIQNEEDMNKATGVKCYFERIKVNEAQKTDYSPVQNDKIENL